MQDTSLEAYRKLEHIGSKQKACYKVIEVLGAACNYDIAGELNWEINRVTPRVKELRDLGLVEEDYRAVQPITKRKVIYWRVVAKPVQLEQTKLMEVEGPKRRIQYV